MDDYVPFALFAMIVALVLGPIYFGTRARSEEKSRMHETLRRALDKGQPIPPEIIEALQQDKPQPTPERDLRNGVIWLAVGLGVGVFGWMVGFEQDDAVYPIIGMASIPALVGLALIALGFLNRGKLP